MDELKQAYEAFVSLIGSGMYLMPPDNDFLFPKEYDFTNLESHRDANTQFIGHRQVEVGKGDVTSEYPCANGLKYQIDFGDSAHKTGILSFSMSEVDQQHLPQFEISPGILVRHPNQPPWNNPNNVTRDQILGFAAGCWRTKNYDIVKRIFDKCFDRAVLGIARCQNSEKDCPGTTKHDYEVDILSPCDVMYLRICSGDFKAYLDPIAQLNLQLAIEFTPKDITLEKNQLLLQAIVCGRLDLYVQVHDNYKENIRYYWDDRKQGQVADAFIDVIEQELKRYSGQPRPSTLGLPIETIKVAFELIGKSLSLNFDDIDKDFQRFFQAVGTDIQKIGNQIKDYITDTLKDPSNVINIPFLPYNPVAKLFKNLFGGTDFSEVYRRLNEIQKGITELKKLSEQILKKIANIPDEVKNKLYLGEINITIDKFKDTSKAYGILINKKGIDDAVQEFSPDLSIRINDFSDSIHRYFEFEIRYIAIPFVVNIMDMHISCITMAKRSPALIIAVIENYKKWIKNVVEDRASDSLFKKIENLQNELRTNVLYIKSLYNLTFTTTEEYSLDDINKKYNPMEPVFYGITGFVRHYDYILHETIDLEKNQNAKQLVDNRIINSDCLPKIVEKKLLAEKSFSLHGTYGEKPPEFIAKITSEQAELVQTFKPHIIWYICKKEQGKESEPYPKFNTIDYDLACESLKILGEKIINLGMIMYIGQTALERIDEIIKTANEILDK